MCVHTGLATARSFLIQFGHVHRCRAKWPLRTGGAASGSYREGKRVRKRKLANLGQLPPAVIDGLRLLLAGGSVIARPEEVFEIQPSRKHTTS